MKKKYAEEKNQSIENDPGMTEMIELAYKNANIKNIIYVLKNVEENMNMMRIEMEDRKMP